MKIVLYQPQIPQNTGNVVRTCSVTATDLILVRPLGFSTQSRHLKRAGLDYWEGVSVEEMDDLEAYLATTQSSFFFFSSKSTQPYTQAPYESESILIFGSETAGLPSHFWEKWSHLFYTIPMVENSRCLNLASSVAIVLYEAHRQNHFSFLKREKRKERAALLKAEEVMGT